MWLAAMPGWRKAITKAPSPISPKPSNWIRNQRCSTKPLPVAPPPGATPAPQATPPPKEILVPGVLQGAALKRVALSYLPLAKAAGVSGRVDVQVIISEEGRVIEAEVVSSPPLLWEGALNAAKQWIFKPTELGGVPVKVKGVLAFNFTLQ
jgi:protein TonB